jgi:RHS repeat-associated protein
LTISRRTRPCAGGDRLSRFAEEALDYYPFGGLHLDSKTNYGGVRNKYAGTVYDALSGLNYMQARYQNSSRGQFISEDPVFLGDPSQQNLRDPQSLNSYAYANDNPITKSDPTGKCAEDACAVEALAVTAPVWMPTASAWGASVMSGIAAGTAYIGTDILVSKSNPGQRFIPFSQQPGRQVTLPSNLPDPIDPWDGWKPGDPKDWKTWANAGLGVVGAATGVYELAKELPNNNNWGSPNGTWSPLPPIVIQGSTTYYRNYSGLLTRGPQSANGGHASGPNSSSFNAQVDSIQAQINSIQAQVNAISQSRIK